MSQLPVPPSDPQPLAPMDARSSAPAEPSSTPRGAVDERQRDFLLLTIFVLAQQGFVDRAGILAEALYLTGDASAEVLLARAVLRFFAEDWGATLTCLDELDRSAPIERFGAYTLTDRQRMRRYLKARCLFELGDEASAREAVAVYLRHG